MSEKNDLVDPVLMILISIAWMTTSITSSIKGSIWASKEARRLARRLRSYYGSEAPGMHKPVRCKECKEPYSVACRVDDPNGRGYYQAEYLCAEHAAKAGYCGSCGNFIAGTDCTGNYCDSCEAEMASDYFYED